MTRQPPGTFNPDFVALARTSEHHAVGGATAHGAASESLGAERSTMSATWSAPERGIETHILSLLTVCGLADRLQGEAWHLEDRIMSRISIDVTPEDGSGSGTDVKQV